MTTLAATGVFRLSWLLLAFPVFGAAVLLLGGRRTDKWGHLLAVLMSLASFVYGVIAFFALLGQTGAARSQDLHVYSWIPVNGFQANIGILIDPLSICFVLLITGVGSLILIYAIAYMAHDSDRRRFFGYLNLFIAAMLLLVVSDNFLGLYVGWEGVGLASYLLIGFWQFKQTAAVAAKKAFIANRVGDVGLSLAIMLMFSEFGTFNFTGVFDSAKSGGTGVTTALGLLLLLGACGKSAQVPLQSWLLDAMEGPTPVSALIHAATMVTAGVYLIVRSNPIFNASPTAQLAVTVVGAVTLLFGAIIGCAKDDIKKALAGSTMSQIGYMILAAGLGPAGYVFAIAHLLAHGFFKAGLFLGAGSVMHGMDDEVNMRRFGGLRKFLPITFATFGLGYLAIIGIPPFSGFFTKDGIIDAAWAKGGTDGWILAACTIVGAAITAFYMTRVMLMTWYGPKRWEENGVLGGAGATPAYTEPHIPHPHESPLTHDDPDDPAGDRLGRRGRVLHHQRAAAELPGAGDRGAVPRPRHLVLARHHRAGPGGPRRRRRLGDVRAGDDSGPRAARVGADPGRPGRPVRRRVQRVGPDAPRPVADQALGFLRQPRRGRSRQHDGGDHRGKLVAAAAGCRTVSCALTRCPCSSAPC